MAFLKRQVKSVLLLLAEEFDTNVSDGNKVREIIDSITQASDYDEETAKLFLERILGELEAEKQKQDREKVLEREELEKARQFELEKLKLQTAVETASVNSTASVTEIVSQRKVNLKDLVPRFDPKEIDISLFLMIFERQARKEKIKEENWVSQLIPLLPIDVAELIIRQPEDQADDYQHIKQVLFKRFKLSTRALRLKFETHTKKQDALWTDLVYELNGYLENWLDSMEVKDFDSLKQLMLTEQLKKRVPREVREHYVDIWDEAKDAKSLAEKCDKFESVRRENRKYESKSFSWGPPKRQYKHGENPSKFDKGRKYNGEESERNTSNETHVKNKEKNFEKTRKIVCFNCGETGHVKPNCPKNSCEKKYPVHNIDMGEVLGEGFEPYIEKALINGQEFPYLRDTGSMIDICESNMISTDDLLPEKVWLRQPLDSVCICLPLAKIVLEGDFGKVVTKAAVKPTEVNQGFYLMGNFTSDLIEKERKRVKPINLIVTRSKAKPEKEKNQSENISDSALETSLFRDSKRQVNSGRKERELGENAEPEAVIPFLQEEEKSPLASVSSEVFCRKQKQCESLQEWWEEVGKRKETEFLIMNDRLVRKTKSKKGDERIQLCLPKCFRVEVMELCHDALGGHLGVCKTKDRVLAHFFWPNCYKEIEAFVRSCDACQKVGKPNDKKKAPLKLVPIISEPFKKLAIDAIGPLIASEKGNKYAITSICLASKYPDAIPIENLSSKSVIHALIQTFSRTGFPQEIQCDLGTSFTSELTNLFFTKYGIKVFHSSISHPQSNPVERVHSTLKRVLKTLCLESGSDWERVLPMALFALRTVTHESTGLSPAEILYGRNLRMPHTIVFENWLKMENADQNVVDYLLDLNNRLKKCQELAERRMAECQQKRKLWYDKNAVSRKFKVGDAVLVLATAKPHKMAVNWLGPGVVTGVVSETNYTVDLPEKRNKDTIYHVNLLKPYHARAEFVNLIIEENLEIEDEVNIPYPIADPNHFDFDDLVKESKLESRLSAVEIGSLQDLLVKHKNVFSSDPGTTPLVQMDIKLTDDKAVRARPYRMSIRQTEILRKEIARLLDLGVIEVGQSDYASPMILVERPGKDPRPCIDYRALNAKTQREYFPLPNIEEVVERVSSASHSR